jgi:hypothetical protein
VTRHASSTLSLSRDVTIISWKPLNWFTMDSMVAFKDLTVAAISNWYFGGFLFFALEVQKNFPPQTTKLAIPIVMWLDN